MLDPTIWGSVLGDWPALPGPRYQRLAEAVRNAIGNGRLAARHPLPAERSMASLLGVSRSTVVSAYDQLAAEGWIERRRGSGTRVAATAPRRPRVLALRTPTIGGTGDLDFTIAVPWLNDAQKAELADAAADAFGDHIYHPLGLPRLRELLADHYTAEGLPTRPDQVLITSGAQQGISLAVTSLLRPGDACVIETPTFFGAIDALRAARARLVGVDVGLDGPSPAEFERAVADHGPRLAFLTPTFQNPTGSVVPAAARERIGELAARRQLPLIEDDTLIDLSFGVATPPRIAALVPEAPIISIGSLSKLYWAGLRVGWMRVPDALLPRLVQAKTLADFGSSLPSQVIACRLLAELPRLRRQRRETALPGRDLLVSLLHDRLPLWEFDLPEGGQFLWVRLPTRNATGYTQVAGRYGVRVFPGAAMGVNALPDCWLRLPFTLPVDQLPDAVGRLAEAWADFVQREGHDRLG